MSAPDIAVLADTLDRIGCGYQETTDHRPGRKAITITAKTDVGMGYSDFYIGFVFDVNGHFVREESGVWE